MKLAASSALLLVLTSCLARPAPVLLTDREVSSTSSLDDYVGRMVTLRGRATETKIPQVLGADVRLSSDALRGQVVEVTGVLHRWVVTEAEAARADELGYAHRGAGTFYKVQLEDSYGAAYAVEWRRN